MEIAGKPTELSLAKEFMRKARAEPMPPSKPLVKGVDFDYELPPNVPSLPGPIYNEKGERVVLPLPKKPGKKPLLLGAPVNGMQQASKPKEMRVRKDVLFR